MRGCSAAPWLGWAGAAALLAGCATPADESVLSQAETALDHARSSPRVRAMAPRELDDAEIALAHAAAVREAGFDVEWVDHLAYLATRRAALAEARAEERIAEARVAALNRKLVVPAAAQAGKTSSSGRSTVVLSLAELPFEGTEPAAATVERVRGLADELRRAPQRRVLLLAPFGAPDPAEATTIERRVELVRNLFVGHGVASSQVLVRAGEGRR